MPRKPNPFDHLEEFPDRDILISALLDHWAGKTLLDIATEVARFANEVTDEEDAFLRAEEEHLATPPEPDQPVPKDLLEPKTLLDAVRKLEMDLERSGQEGRARSAGRVRCCLRSGNIHTVAKELTDLSEEADEAWDRILS